MDFARLTTQQKISSIAMLVVAVGAFLPWASLLGINAYGIQGDGVLTLIFALAGLALLAFTSALLRADRTQNKSAAIASLVMAVLVTIIGLNDTTNFAAIGIYLTDLGGIAWIVGAGWQLAVKKQPAQSVMGPPPGAGPTG